jgi:hypothetical protein
MPVTPPPPQYASLAARLTEQEFVHLFPHEYLVTESIEAAVSLALDVAPTPGPEETTPTFDTEALRAIIRPRPILAIYPILKRDGQGGTNAIISVGRSRRNDVVIDDPSVSKAHASLRRLTDDGASAVQAWNLHGEPARLAITDSGSKNGTAVDGVPVGPDPRAVALGARVRLGTVLFWVADGRMLYCGLRALTDAANCAA